jgi:hypothetical protein
MRAMNAFRRFLLRDGVVSRVSILVAFAILFVRALLPGAVMLDSEAAAQGGFALVMCSGHGPMFARSTDAMPGMSDSMDSTMSGSMDSSMPGMDMSPMPGMIHDSGDLSGSPAHDSMTGDDGLCPFSAALVVACVGIALAVVLFTLTRITQSWRIVAARPLPRPCPHFRPLSRAPPLFS